MRSMHSDFNKQINPELEREITEIIADLSLEEKVSVTGADWDLTQVIASSTLRWSANFGSGPSPSPGREKLPPKTRSKSAKGDSSDGLMLWGPLWLSPALPLAPNSSEG